MKAGIENALDGECWKGQGEQLDQACHNLRILAFERPCSNNKRTITSGMAIRARAAGRAIKNASST